MYPINWTPGSGFWGRSISTNWLLVLLAIGFVLTSFADAASDKQVYIEFTGERPIPSTVGAATTLSSVSLTLGRATISTPAPTSLFTFPPVPFSSSPFRPDSGLDTWIEENSSIMGELLYEPMAAATGVHPFPTSGHYSSLASTVSFNMPELGPVTSSSSEESLIVYDYPTGISSRDSLIATISRFDGLPTISNEVGAEAAVNLKLAFPLEFVPDLPSSPLIVRVSKSSETLLDAAFLSLRGHDNSVFDSVSLPSEIDPEEFDTALVQISTKSDLGFEVVREDYANEADFQMAQEYIDANLTSFSLQSSVRYNVNSLTVRVVPEPASLVLLSAIGVSWLILRASARTH